MNITALTDYEKVKWPSERIPQGGMFHAPKVKYSKETSDLIKLLMEESKLSMHIRKKVNYHLRNGEPLPPPPPPKAPKNMSDNAQAMEIINRARAAKRKSLGAIMASGVYEMPRYRPPPDGRLPSGVAKLKLQEAMSGLRMTDMNVKPKRRTEITEEFSQEPEDLIDELLYQINERAEWLAEMEELGEGKRYRDDIRGQIADRLRRIKILEKKIEFKKQGYRFVD